MASQTTKTNTMTTMNTSKEILLDEAKQLLEEYNQWEADIIMEDKLWWPNRAEDVLRGDIYDKMIELQEKRNDLLKRIDCLYHPSNNNSFDKSRKG